MCRIWLLLGAVLAVLACALPLAAADGRGEKLRATKLPPCRACKVLVESFRKGMEKTKRGKFEGGDAAWEEEKLGTYARSEIRLVEVQEALCADVEEGKDQCFALADHHDASLEEWWFKRQDDHPDLYEWLCIRTANHCCPELHFGSDCAPCPGFPDDVCSKNGKCKGAGTRKGNGQCLCDMGYTGPACAACSDGYYEAYKDDSKLLCSKCHMSCEGKCSQAGPKGCAACAKGWFLDAERGCLDVNECTFDRPVCKPSQFCVNTEGSYRCLNCDQACAGCTGDGPDMCTQCKPGYTLFDNVCIDASEKRNRDLVSVSRYITYFGLCVATCIILHKNTMVAAAIGVCVAAYIALSEYMLSEPSSPLANRTAFHQVAS